MFFNRPSSRDPEFKRRLRAAEKLHKRMSVALDNGGPLSGEDITLAHALTDALSILADGEAPSASHTGDFVMQPLLSAYERAYEQQQSVVIPAAPRECGVNPEATSTHAESTNAYMDEQRAIYGRLLTALQLDEQPDLEDLTNAYLYCESVRVVLGFHHRGSMERLCLQFELLLPAASGHYFLCESVRRLFSDATA